MHPQMLRELEGEAALNNIWSIMATGRIVQRLEEWKCYSYLQEGQEGEPKELQVGQSHLNPLEIDRAVNSGNYFQVHEWQVT